MSKDLQRLQRRDDLLIIKAFQLLTPTSCRRL